MQNKRVLIWLAFALLALVLAACGNIQTQSNVPEAQPVASQSVQEVFPLNPVPSAETGAMVDETPALWFVEFASQPRTKGGSQAALRNERAAFAREAAAEGIQYRERFNFESLFNGLSVQATPAQANKFRQLSGVVNVYPVVTVSIPETQATLEPEMATALAMTGADFAQDELGLSGQGIRVAIMDTGIDYNHPDLGGGWGNRVVAGWDFVGDEFAANIPGRTTPNPSDDPMDCNGHGTHVAGIVGASGQVTGVAPGVEFGAYKVFGCEGSTTADIMIAAMEMALADNMDILNMSIGSAFQWPQYPTAVAASNLVDAGMVVVASIGNSGANGLYSAGAPGLGEKVIGVASFDNTHVSAMSFIVNPSGQQVPYFMLSTTVDAPTSGTTPEIVYVGRGCPIDPGFTTVEDEYLADPQGKVALIDRGECSFNGKYQRAVDNGAVAVLIANNVAGLNSGGGVVDRGVPGVTISLADGNHIKSLLNAGATTLTWTNERVNSANPTGNLISSFSSYGLAPDLTLKPDIGGPGGLIRAPYPLALGGYAVLSGTSMSAPHVAGTAALLLEAQPHTRAEDVRDILQNSAEPRVWWGNPALGFLDNVHRQGAGMVNIANAITSTTSVTPAKLSLGESETGPATRTLTIRNTGNTSVMYDLSHVPALSSGGSTFSPSTFTGFASVAFSNSSVTVPAGGSATVSVTITANPALADRSQYGGYIVMTGDNGQVSRVPYAGFKGDYQSITVLNPTPFGFPWLASLEGDSFFNQPGGATYSMQGDDIPFFLLHLAHQSQRLEMRILHADTKRPVHPVFSNFVELDYLPRNSTSTGFFAFEWDGTRLHNRGLGNDNTKTVSNGNYVVELRVLKALGNPSNPAHWETWTSPTITVARPPEAPRPTPPGRR